MIKRLYKLNSWLPLVKDFVAHRAPYQQRGVNIFLVRCKMSHKNVSHIKLEVIRTVVYFPQMTKQTRGKIIVGLDIIRKDESTQLL